MGLHTIVEQVHRPSLNTYTVKMKFLFVAALILVGGYYADAKRCQTNADCEPEGCCWGFGHLLWCHDFTKIGDYCTISSRYGCGCAPGLVCKRTGTILETCVNGTVYY